MGRWVVISLVGELRSANQKTCLRWQTASSGCDPARGFSNSGCPPSWCEIGAGPKRFHLANKQTQGFKSCPEFATEQSIHLVKNERCFFDTAGNPFPMTRE